MQYAPGRKFFTSKEQLQSDYQHLPEKEILAKYNISSTTFRRWLSKYSIPILFKNIPANISEKTLRGLYEKEKLSKGQIAKKLNISSTTIHKYLLRYGIATRSVAEGKHLIQANHVILSDEAMDFLIGDLLGDGALTPGTFASHFQRSCKYKEYLEWMIQKLNSYGIQCTRSINKTKHKAGYCFSFCTRRYPELLNIRNKFYPNRKKIIPRDLQLTPLMCLMWFIGDGCNNNGSIFLCTDGFTQLDVDFLIKLFHKKNIECTHMKCHNRIRIRNESRGSFFEYIGECPKEISHLYNYKWK